MVMVAVVVGTFAVIKCVAINVENNELRRKKYFEEGIASV